MMALMVGTVVWAIYFDTMQPNPGLTAPPATPNVRRLPDATAPGGKREITLPPVAGLPVDQHLGNLEGKELRFGTSAGATFRRLDDRRHLRRGQLRARQPESRSPACRR